MFSLFSMIRILIIIILHRRMHSQIAVGDYSMCNNFPAANHESLSAGQISLSVMMILAVSISLLVKFEHVIACNAVILLGMLQLAQHW